MPNPALAAVKAMDRGTQALYILREFMADVEAVGVKQVGREWPDLLITYNKARMLLKEVDHA